MNGEQEWIWKEVAVISSRYCPGACLDELENHETPKSGCPVSQPRIEPTALPLCYPLGKEVGVSAQSTPVRKVPGLNLNRIIDYFV
jgi:hypothetical protein